MSLSTWRPFSGDLTFDDTLTRFRREFDRMVSDTFADPSSRHLSGPGGPGAYIPRVDVREVDNNIVVHAELPGVSKENVNVDIRDNHLLISGENKREEKSETSTGWIKERRFGRFQRCIPLPGNVDTEKTCAKFTDGILEIKLPRTKESAGRRVNIE